MAAGECIGAIAMPEPGAGSDLQGIRTTAVRDGDGWVLNGAKTFITNGIHSDLVIVVARTDPGAGSHGISLLVAERGMPGFTRGRKLDKIGLHAQDTAELFFDDVRVPAANLLGREGDGFVHLMERLPRERLSIAMMALASVRAALDWTVDYVTQRTAFGRPLAAFQNTAFELATAVTEVDVLEAYLDKAVLALNAGTLTAVDAAKAKLWATEVQHRVFDRCLQLFGGQLAADLESALDEVTALCWPGGTTPPDPPATGGTHPPGPPLGGIHPPGPPWARAVLLRAEGKVFCGGVDVHEFQGLGPSQGAALMARFLALVQTLERVPVPTIAVVHALNLTIGFELSLGCDLMWAAEDASFGLVEATVGLTPGGGGTQRLVARAGVARAAELVMTGDIYPAAELHQWGVVNRILAPAVLLEQARSFAARLAAGPTAATAVGKRLLL